MNDLVVKENLNIKDLIYEVRGKEVMLDSDLAFLYGVETKRINETVKNNPLKFPERYCFRITDNESKSFLVENFDQKIETRGGKYKNPRVFTEQGVAMLATILKSKKATEVSINIMDAFVTMRHFIVENKNVFKNIIEIKDVNKFKSEYSNVKLIKTTIFHDRFIIIDKSILYHLGSSLNSIGTKYFCVNKISDKDLLEKIIKQLCNIN